MFSAYVEVLVRLLLVSEMMWGMILFVCLMVICVFILRCL